MSLRLEHVLDYHVDLDLSPPPGPGPFGQRLIFTVTGGTVRFRENGMQGKVLPRGEDWMLMDPTGVRRLNVRSVLCTDDGAQILMSYDGVLKLPDDVEKALARNEEPRQLGWGEAYFVTQPRFETGHVDYEWINSIVCLGEGKVALNAADFRVYKVGNYP